ncbi:MAG: hypothetical protein KF778_07700 [Rhodocyclaceae bacterium]|nr:hypothetical protein [Rhodocyclaceae bacterium]MBX3668273.1 hypothetical protein [Rhodocyclaceae bacterium]
MVDPSRLVPDRQVAPIATIAAAIAAHLERCPNSSDTVDGIQLWWVGPLVPGATLENTFLALQLLERQGLVERSDLAGRSLWHRPR